MVFLDYLKQMTSNYTTMNNARLSVPEDQVSDEAIREARRLFMIEPGFPVDAHNASIEAAKSRFGVGQWFAAIEIVRRESLYDRS